MGLLPIVSMVISVGASWASAAAHPASAVALMPRASSAAPALTNFFFPCEAPRLSFLVIAVMSPQCEAFLGARPVIERPAVHRQQRVIP